MSTAEHCSDVSANTDHLATSVKLKLTRDDGNLNTLQPLIVSDLLRSVDEHNSSNRIVVDNVNHLQHSTDLKLLYLNIRSLPSHYLELELLIDYSTTRIYPPYRNMVE